MPQLTPEAFVQAWNDEAFCASLRDDEQRRKWCPPLIRASPQALEKYVLPEKDKAFLLEAGLPERSTGLVECFDTLQGDIVRVSDLRPDKIHNGIELPTLRYTLFLKIAHLQEWSETDTCVEEFTGRVWRLAYAENARHTSVRSEYGGWRGVTLDKPVLDGQTCWSTGPYFVNSSVSQLASMMLTFRNIYVPQYINAPRTQELSLKEKNVYATWGAQQEERLCRRVSKLLGRELRKIDEVAVVRPDSVWHVLLEAIHDGLE